MTDNSGNGSSENSSAPGSRNGSVGGLKQGRPKQNVKFSVGGNSENEEQPKRHSLPEIRLSTGPDLGEVPLSPLPAREFIDWASRTDAAAINAFDRANRHANKVKRNNSLPVSRRSSLDDSSTLLSHSPAHISPPQKALVDHPIRLDDVPMEDLSKSKHRSHYDIAGESTDSDTDEDAREQSLKPAVTASGKNHYDEARKLVRSFTRGFGQLDPGSGIQYDRSGTATPAVDQRSHEYDYVPVPDQYKPSVLSMLLASQFGQQMNENRSSREAQQDQTNYLAAKLAPYQDPKTDPRQQQTDFFSRKQRPTSSGHFSGSHSPYSPYESSGQSSTSGRATPRQKRPKWYKDEFQAQSNSSVAQLLGSASMAGMASATPGMTPLSRPPMSRKGSAGVIDQAINVVKHPISHIRRASASNRTDLRSHVLEMHTMNIAERIASQKYLLKMCRALMALGAPTHRLEEYLQMASRKLLVAASFQYLPGCMIVAFDDPTTHTTEVHLVKEPTQVDLGKLQDIQEVYKDVMHDKYSVDEAITDMREILTKPKKFSTPILVLIYGVASVSVGPFAFSAQPQDFPISFLLGCVLGSLQLVLASRSTQFSHIFEVAGAFATSFAARGFGSIYNANGVPAFCFSALAQSSIALILPGWIILSAALELQSRNLVAGSVRLIFAVIYTLFLGFGILLGATFMGLFYSDSTNDITCHLPEYWDATDQTLWKLIYTKFIWVPIFTLCLAMVNQAKWKQMPWMVFISICGYQVNYWSGRRFSQNNQIANALGALTIGVLANLYSRLGHGVAAATMLPAIFVMVPSGLAASGSLIAGLSGANQITHNVTGIAFNSNGTQTVYDATNSTSASDPYGNSIFDVGAGMIQVAIAISVGLFLSALIVYPFGKKRSALFSF